MYQIGKAFHFSASHHLTKVEEGHPCARLHGHNYTVEIVLEADDVAPDGMLVDYRRLGRFREWLEQEVDHRHLNDVCPYETTAENLARWFFQTVQQHAPTWNVVSVTVSEGSSTWAMYEP